MMENVLYEYHFDLLNYSWNLIPLLIGIVFCALSVYHIKEKGAKTGWRGFVGLVIGFLCVGLFLLSSIGMLLEHMEYQDMLAKGDVHVVEGYVENYHPMPFTGHDTERFEINGVFFEYSDYEIANGYHNAASHGGVVTQNGQHLRIKYIPEECDGETVNIILYIGEIE